MSYGTQETEELKQSLWTQAWFQDKPHQGASLNWSSRRTKRFVCMTNSHFIAETVPVAFSFRLAYAALQNMSYLHHRWKNPCEKTKRLFSLWRCFQSDHMLGYHLHLLLWVLLTTISTTIQLLEIHKGMHKVLKIISWCTQDFFQMLGKHQTYGNLKSGQKTATNNSETV